MPGNSRAARRSAIASGWLMVALLLVGVRSAFAQDYQAPVSAARVLVVKNTKSPDAVAIADYYVKKRRVPVANVCPIACPTTEECTQQEYAAQILAPVKEFIAKNKRDVDFILLTKGMPIRIKGGKTGGYCVDSMLAMMDWTILDSITANPYFGKAERFSHKRFNIYLVTRLDGYTRADCLKLVDHSLAARFTDGPFLLNQGSNHGFGGYKVVVDGIQRAEVALKAKRMTVFRTQNDGTAGQYQNLMGYFSWGSNDHKHNPAVYHSLTFAPGALAETAVSTSGRTFEDPKAKGQSLIADLIAQGVTGCKGYVSEPFVDAIALADQIFTHYTSGYTLAESFYAASRFIYWKDIVIGDPICAPYAVTK